MNYDEAIDYIHGTYKLGWKLGLQNIRHLLELLDSPHEQLKFVHIAGTNGKGSTAAFISSILMKAGLSVGVFTSPHLIEYTERIKVNNREIPRDDLARITGNVKDCITSMVSSGMSHPTEFEVGTAIAMKYFAECKCDVVVLEVGLGGRFDSTNVIEKPLAAVIATINYDHMKFLGNTLEEIAFEKAGIIKQGCDVVLYPQEPGVEKVFSDICVERGARLHKPDLNTIKELEYDIDGQTFDFANYPRLKIRLLGDHQIRNAALAVKTAEVLSQNGIAISREHIYEGLESAQWPGRLEVVNKAPTVLVDGAHNPEAAGMLALALKKYFPGRKVKFIVGVMKDKEYASMIESVLPAAEGFITVSPDDPRALPVEELAAFLEQYCKNVRVGGTIDNALRLALEDSSPDDVICAFGSLYYIGWVRKYFNT